VSKRWQAWTGERLDALRESVDQYKPKTLEGWNRVAVDVDERGGLPQGTTTGNAARMRYRQDCDAPPHVQIETEQGPPLREPIEDRWEEMKRVTAMDLERHRNEKHLRYG